VATIVPDSSEGQVAKVRRLRVRAAQTAGSDGLRAVGTQVDRLAQAGTAGAALTEARALQRLIRLVVDAKDSGEVLPFRSAELARDSLRAPRLAASLLVEFARAHPASLFAPKALIAALPLAVEQRDSLVAVLHATYGASPYVLALQGKLSPAYAGAEDSLARALGVVLEHTAVYVASLVGPPVPGPRGPPLDPEGPERAAPPRLPGRGPVQREDGPDRSDWRRPLPERR
jgi:hypothetical protein